MSIESKEMINLDSNDDVFFWYISVEGNVKVTVEDYSCKLDFDSEPVTIWYSHEQDCCEQVYIDWEQLLLYKDEIENNGPYKSFFIKGVPDMGILFIFSKTFDLPSNDDVFDLPVSNDVKVFVPSYNCQNGYYSDELTLLIKYGDHIEIYDVSAYHKDIEE